MVTTRRWLYAVALVAGAGALFRLFIVAAYHSTSPDGDQYFALAQELAREGRYSFFPQPYPLAYSRLPGYPLLLLLIHGGPVTQAIHLVGATRFNALCDVGTGLLLLAILRERKIGRPAALLAMVAVILCPLHFLFASYALTESVATTLTLLELWLVVRAMRERLLLHAALAGVAAGVGQLVRADAIALAPAVLLALWWAEAPRERRLEAMGAWLVALALMVAPWAIRNLVQFGAPHVAATEWPSQDGRPLRTGAIRWMRTWSNGAPGDCDLANQMVFGSQITPYTAVSPKMYDSPEEQKRIVEALTRYNRTRLSPDVDAEFNRLADERTARNPWRTWVQLPVERLVVLYRPPRSFDFPIRVGFLGLPATRNMFEDWNVATYLLTLVGLGFALFAGALERRLAILFMLAVAARSLLHMFAVPTYVSQRYLAEVYPLFLGAAAYGSTALFTRTRALVTGWRWRRRG